MERRHRAAQTIEPELFALLEAIRETGKLTDATAKVGLPYRQAWGLITKWSDIIGQPLVAMEKGRGSRLTALGERVLWLRERIEARLLPHLESAASEVEQQLRSLLDEPHPAIPVYASHDLALAELRDLLRTRATAPSSIFASSAASIVSSLCARGAAKWPGFMSPRAIWAAG